VRVVDGVHRHAAGLGADALPAVAAGLADLEQLVLGVADRTDRGAAVDRHAAHLGGGQAQRRVLALAGDELHAGAGRAGHLAARARLDLDVVHHRADGDVAQRQRVAGPDLRALARLHHVADLQVLGGEDVALLAVVVVQQRDAAGAVRVVLDGRDLGRHAVLVPLEVDAAVLLLVAAAAVAGGLAAPVVAATGLRLRREQRLLGLVAGDVGEGRDRLETAAGAGGLALADGHVTSPRTGRSGRRRPTA